MNRANMTNFMIRIDSGNENWFRISEQDNIFDNLNKTLYFFKKARKDNSFWKWVIVAFHSALYGSMLLALRRTDLSNIWEREIRDTKNHINIKKSRLISFFKAFEWIQDDQRMQKYVKSKSFKLVDQNLKDSIVSLNNEFRNQFLHYKPLGWSIEKEALREVVRDCLPLIEFLLFQSGNIAIERDRKNQAKEVTAQIRNFVRKSKSQKGTENNIEELKQIYFKPM